MRAEGRDFRLPGGDGAVVLAAGLWSALLLILRLFDKPGITQHGVAANVGIQWGIFFALAAAGLLAYAGSRMRAAQRPEPPLLRRDRSPRRPQPAPAHPRPPRSPNSDPPRAEQWDSTRRDGNRPLATCRRAVRPSKSRRSSCPAEHRSRRSRAGATPGTWRGAALLEDTHPVAEQ